MTRPQPTAAATAARLVAMGHEPILAPCLIISRRDAVLPEQPSAIILTSSQAVPALPPRLRHLPAFCVGDVTADRLRQAGFTDVLSASGDADDLFWLVTSRKVNGPHLLAVGADQGCGLAQRLRDAGVAVARCVVYAATPAAALPDTVRSALTQAEIAAALFYSAETAQAFIQLAPLRTDTVAAYALSPRIAAVLSSLPWRAIHVAGAPSEAALLALLHE